MTYPATNFEEAVSNTITSSDQLHQVINGSVTDTVTTDSGEIPSVRKALTDNMYFVEAIPWAQGSNETVFNQLRTFTDNAVYWAPTATVSNPVPMGATPVGDSNWALAPVSLTEEKIRQVSAEISNAGDSQLAWGKIFPVDNTLIPLGSQSTNVPTGVSRLKIDTGGSGGELLYLWEASGDFQSQVHTITNIVTNAYAGYTVTTDNGVYEFLPSTRHAARRIGDVSGWGADGGGFDDTDSINTALATNKEITFDLTEAYKVTSINLNAPTHLKDANIVFDGLDGGFNVDSPIDGFSITGGILEGDGDVANDQKGVTSNSPLTNAKFRDVTVKNFVQGLDLNSAINPSVIGGHVSGSVGESAGQGYGIVAGSSTNGRFSSTFFELCQRHALYLNNAKHSAVTGNIFKKHREGLVTGGGLGALQIAGEATAISESGSVFSECTGPELVISPQPTNTKPLECVSAAGGVHYGSKSASVRIGGATPSPEELPVAVGVKSRVFMPDLTLSGSLVQVYSGYGVDVSSNTFYLKNGTGATPQAIRLGLTTPDDTFFDNISICNNNGIFTKVGGGAVFVRVSSELCLGDTRIDIFDNHVETDIYIDYGITPTNPNIRTDDTSYKRINLQGGNQDLNVAAYNNFVIVGAGGGSTIDNIVNGYTGKVIKILVEGTNIINMTSTGNKSIAGSFSSTNKDIITLEYDGVLWRELSRSLNT